MPNEPNSPIEQQLKAYADERRKQAGEPFALPPHTRRVLRDHVDRFSGRLKAEEPVAAEQWWRWFWPFVGLGVSALATLVVCLAIWLEKHPAPAPKQVAAIEEGAGEQSRVPEEADEEMPSLASTDKPSEASDKLPSPSAGHLSPDSLPAAAPLLAPAPAAPTNGTVGNLSAIQPTVAGAAKPPAPGGMAGGLPPSSAPGSSAFGTPAQDRASAPMGLVSRPAPVPDATTALAVDGVRTRSAEPPVAIALQAVTKTTPTAPAPSIAPAVGGVMTAAARSQARVKPETDNRLATYRNTTSNQANQLGQRYVQNQPAKEWRRNLNSPPRSTILNSFVLQPQGDRLQVIDEDGSVYEGSVRSAAETTRSAASIRGGPATKVQSLAGQNRAEAGSSATAVSTVFTAPEKGVSQVQQGEVFVQNEVLFRAVGTNRSSRQKVVFDGRLILTNAPAQTGFAQQQNPLRQEIISQGGASAFQEMLFNNAAVQGRATIGGRTQVEINAVQAPR